jgi:predicted DCC family thiol-disulfide oxidoreductase YuxK
LETKESNTNPDSSEYLIIDFDCGICTTFWSRVLKFDKYKKLQLLPISTINQLTYSFSGTINEANIAFVDKQGIYFAKSRAIFEAFKRLAFPFNILGYVLSNIVFETLVNPFYIVIRDNRHRISNYLGLKSCEINYKSDKLSRI